MKGRWRRRMKMNRRGWRGRRTRRSEREQGRERIGGWGQPSWLKGRVKHESPDNEWM